MRAAGIAGAFGQRSAGSLSVAGRRNQRQAHRDHRAPDVAQGENYRPGRYVIALGRSGGQTRLRGRKQEGRRERRQTG